MRILGGIGIVVGLGLLAPAAARAQISPETEPQAIRRSGAEHLRTGMGVGVMAGGGVTNFAREAAREVAGVGGFWEVRGVVGTRRLIGAELAYVGSAHDIDAPGIASGAALVGHGAEGTARLNLPLIRRGVLLEPFAFVGLGWTNYGLVNEGPNTSRVASNDNVMTVPFGAGATVGYRGFIADARFTFRPVVEHDLVALEDGDRAGLGSWAVGLRGGFEF